MAYIRVTFTEPASPPSNGYVFKYRAVGSSVWIDAGPIASVGANQIITAGVDSIASDDYEVLIQSDCGSGVFGDPIVITATAVNCISHSVQNTSGTTTYSFQFRACATNELITVYLPPSTTSDPYCLVPGTLTLSNVALIASAAGTCSDPETG